jgi:hypothetical protein
MEPNNNTCNASKLSDEVNDDSNKENKASTKKTSSKKLPKRPLEEVMADIPDPKRVKFDPLPIPSKHPPILRLPPTIDTDDPYALFTLFWPEKMWTTIATNTNLYASEKRFSAKERRQRAWHGTSPAELKAFVGILIYMGLYPIYGRMGHFSVPGTTPKFLVKA